MVQAVAFMVQAIAFLAPQASPTQLLGYCCFPVFFILIFAAVSAAAAAAAAAIIIWLRRTTGGAEAAFACAPAGARLGARCAVALLGCGAPSWRQMLLAL